MFFIARTPRPIARRPNPLRALSHRAVAPPQPLCYGAQATHVLPRLVISPILHSHLIRVKRNPDEC